MAHEEDLYQEMGRCGVGERKSHINLVEARIQACPDITLFDHPDDDYDFYGGDDSRGEMASQGGDLILNNRGGGEMGVNLKLAVFLCPHPSGQGNDLHGLL